MFDDPRKELQRMEAQLLASEQQPAAPAQEDDWLERELAEAHRLLGDDVPSGAASRSDMDQTQVYRNYANGYGQQPPVRNYANGYGQQPPVRNYANGYGTRTAPAPAEEEIDEEYSDQVEEEVPVKEKGVGFLTFLACVEALGILGVVVYWLLVLL